MWGGEDVGSQEEKEKDGDTEEMMEGDEDELDEGVYLCFAQSVPIGYAPIYNSKPVHKLLGAGPTRKLPKDELVIMRCFAGAKNDPVQPNGGWMCGEVRRVLAAPGAYNCEVHFDLMKSDKDVVLQLLSSKEYLPKGRDIHDAAYDDVAPGTWVAVREKHRQAD
jgi:hypothetical protein